MVEKAVDIPLPILELRPSLMVFPGTSTSIYVTTEITNRLYSDISEGKHKYILAVMSDIGAAKNTQRFFNIGVICKTELIEEDSLKRVVLVGQMRLRIIDYSKPDPKSYYIAQCVRFDDRPDKQFVEQGKNFVTKPAHRRKMRSMRLEIKKLLEELAELIDYVEEEKTVETIGLHTVLEDIDDYDFYSRDMINNLMWSILCTIPEANFYEKRSVLGSDSLMKRLDLILNILSDQIEIYEKMLDIDQKLRGTPHENSAEPDKKSKTRNIPITGGKVHDDFMDRAHPDLQKRWKKYKDIENTINSEGQTALIDSFKHLAVISTPERSSADWSTHMNYIDVLLDLYSCVTTQQETDIVKVESVLGSSHYGMDEIKERIYNYLTAKILNPRGKGPTPCFVGPPGVGKTSIGKSIAEALGRKFIRLSLGGVKDEGEIRGHRRTYIGAVPGKIIEQLKRSGVKNPVFLLDEIDKMSMDGHGDPAAALLEVLDPEQNHSFRDHYADVPFDLSEVLFLCTANVAEKIPQALRDRMGVIYIAGYTEAEKIQIAKRYLIPEQIAETGFPGDKVKILWPDNDTDKGLSHLIGGYTREAGVRGLKREIYRFLSAWNRRYLKIDADKRLTELLITNELLGELLGLARDREQATIAEIGEAIGLVWTRVGGEIMYIHAELTPHIRTEKDISQTGNLGKVFQEANHNAVTVVKNLLRNDKQAMDKLRENLLCLSVPDLAIGKDGPSAGISMATAIYSELTDKLCQPFLAMTGELTIKGRVRAIGGVKEKILAAQRAGIKKLILPESNRRNVDKDISEEVKNEFEFYYVNRIEEVIEVAFSQKTPAI